MIKDLIVRLMEEANEEAEHKGWCDTELSTNEQTRKEKTAAVETLHAEIDELSASIAKLTQEITDLTAEIAEIDKAVAEATAIREEEKATNEQTIKDAVEAQTAVAQALTVLKEFYEKAAEAGRGKTQAPALRNRFLRWQPHHEDQLDEKERDRENPVDVPIGIVERLPRQFDDVVALIRAELHIECVIPGVEDSEVVVGRDEGHQACNRQRCAVVLGDVRNLQPEEYRRASHPSDAKRKGVVHRAPTSVVPTIDKRRHDFS